MRDEVIAAVEFLTKFVQVKLSKECIAQFQQKLTERLRSHYQDHWFPESPNKGSGYRCIRINGQVMDPIVDRVAKESGIADSYSQRLFPDELTMWIDPNDVSYRIGESGSIGQVEVRSVEQNRVASPKRPSTPLNLEPKRLLSSCKEQFSRGFSNVGHGYPITGLTPYAAFAS